MNEPLKLSVYLNGKRMVDQAAGIQAFKDACRREPRPTPDSMLLAMLHEVAAGRMTPEKAAEALGCNLTPVRS